MKVSGKRITAFVLFFSQLFCGQALAGELPTGPCYTSDIDTEASNFDKGIWYYRCTAASGTEVLLEEGDKHTFLMINGSLSEENVILENGRAYMDLNKLCAALGLSVQETAAALTIGNGSDAITLDRQSLSAKRDNGEEVLTAMLQGNDIYVPVRAFSTLFHADVTYSRQNIMPLFCPLIDIDNREKGVSKEQALQDTKKMLLDFAQTYELEDLYADYVDTDKGKAELQTAIETMRCTEETAGFWILQGPRLLLIDKAIGAAYYKTGNGKAGHGSYVETLSPLAGNETNLFRSILLQGVN